MKIQDLQDELSAICQQDAQIGNGMERTIITRLMNIIDRTYASIFQFRYEPEAKPIWPQSSYRLIGLKVVV
jgi:hypothetical protein